MVNESPVDPRTIKVSKVVVWYSADDDDCPPAHGKWLADFFNAKTRVLEGYGHVGGCIVDQVEFLMELLQDAARGDNLIWQQVLKRHVRVTIATTHRVKNEEYNIWMKNYARALRTEQIKMVLTRENTVLLVQFNQRPSNVFD